MEKKLTSEQQTRIMVAVTYMDDRKKLDAELKKLQKLNNEGKAAPKGYADSALSTQAKLDKLHGRSHPDAQGRTHGCHHQEVRGRWPKLKEQIAAKKAEKAEAMKIREYKAALARKIMVKPSDAINYEQAQAMYGIQALIDPNFRREGVNVAMFGGKATLTAEEASYIADAFAEGSTEDEIIDANRKRNYERLVEQRKPLNDWTIEELEELANEMAELATRAGASWRPRRNGRTSSHSSTRMPSSEASSQPASTPNALSWERGRTRRKTSPKRTVLAARYATLPMRAKAMMLDGDTQGAAYNLLVLRSGRRRQRNGSLQKIA